ncbi:MAG: hypothetical protein ACMG57_01100 [Candidatus Dojkabacteria bacterium]
MDEFDADFPKKLGNIRPALLRIPLFINLYNTQNVNPEFTEAFSKGANTFWVDFVARLNQSLDSNKRFNLEAWVTEQTDRIAIEEVHEQMPLEEFMKPCIRLIELYYVLSNVQEIRPGIYIGLPQSTDLLNKETQSKNLLKSLNFVATTFTIYYESYLGELHTKAEAEKIRQTYLSAASNTASKN